MEKNIRIDQNIVIVQNYLNAMFGGHPDWIPLEVNGQTGTLLMQGIVRAFQIQHDIPGTGILGPTTIAKMQEMLPIYKMDPSDEPLIDVCLIQCALFAKGYNAGGVTGIYYTTGVNAVKAFQDDASITVTGTIDWKVWTGLLSLNWFTLAYGGDALTRSMQKALNNRYSDTIGVQACDGVMSRNTALSVLVGLLRELEVINEFVPDLSAYSFGENTKNAFISKVGVLRSGITNDDPLAQYVRFVKYGLLLNEIRPVDLSGDFTVYTENEISHFQNLMKLIGTTADVEGTVGVSTMMSLLSSRGDFSRTSEACDTSNKLTAQQARDLRRSGYSIVGRYLTGTVGSGASERSKALRVTEIKNCATAGLAIFPIYQDGGSYLNYFKYRQQGTFDAMKAISTADRLGFTSGTTIYFACDYDFTPSNAELYLIPYFRDIKRVFTTINSKYKVGIYASRQVCSLMKQNNLVDNMFVLDMSTAYSGNLGYAIPSTWAFDQFHEYQYGTSEGLIIDIDKVAYSGQDNGCSSFIEKDELTPSEELKMARDAYVMSFAKSFYGMDQFLQGYEIRYDGVPITLAQSSGPGYSIEIKLSTSLAYTGDNAQVAITWGADGKLSASTQAQIEALSLGLGVDVYSPDALKEQLTSTSIGLKSGNLSTETTASGNTLTIKYSAETNLILTGDDPIENTVSSELFIIITLEPGTSFEGVLVNEVTFEKVNEIDWQTAAQSLVVIGVAIVAGTAVLVTGAAVLPALVEFTQVAGAVGLVGLN